MGEKPGQHAWIDSSVFAQGDFEIALGRESGLIEEIEVDEIARLGTREDAGQLACPQVGERFDNDSFEWRRRSRDVGNGLLNDVNFNTISIRSLQLRAHQVAHVAKQY